jgi:hypothetical protein
LRNALWDPNAERYYNVWSGGFYWTDEKLREAGSVCREQDNWGHRVIIGYRASLIKGNPRYELKEAWDYLQKECPDWPGFRPERISSELAADLEQANQKTLDEFDVLMDA